MILIHLSGDLVAWKSLDSFKTAVRMGQAALKDLILTQQLNALVDATAEPGIKITYERNSAFNPAEAAGTSVVSTSEVLIHQAWLLVVGWASDQQQVEQHLAQVRSSLEGILLG